MTLEIQVLAWDRHKNVTGLNRLMRLDDGYVTPGNMCSGRWICQPRQYVQWTMDMSPQAICAEDRYINLDMIHFLLNGQLFSMYKPTLQMCSKCIMKRKKETILTTAISNNLLIEILVQFWYQYKMRETNKRSDNTNITDKH